MKLLKKINWINVVFLSLMPILGVAGLVYLIAHDQIHWATIVFALVYTYITGVAITAGMHRLFSHRAYKANRWVRYIFALLTTADFEGSVLEWCTDHRRHHLYTDTDRDPYSIKKGFWYAHMGWLFVLRDQDRDYSNVEDLSADPFLRFTHKYYIPTAILTGFIFPMLVCWMWGDPLGGLLIAGVLRVGFNEQVTFCINSVCHVFGKRTYSDKQSACDNWFTALFTYGEGFHNFHHQFPLDYRNGVRYYHYDPAKWLIRLLEWMGLAWDLKRIPDQKILQYRLREEERRMHKQANDASLLKPLSDLVVPLKDKLFALCSRIDELEGQLNEAKTAYQQMKQASKDYTQERIAAARVAVHEYQQRLKTAKKELKTSLTLWTHLLKTYQLKLPS